MPAEQTLRTQQQDEQHREKEYEVGKLWQEGLTKIVDETHYDAADERAEQAARAAEDDHDQGEGQHVLVEPGITRKDRPADNAGESRKTSAEREHDRE